MNPNEPLVDSHAHLDMPEFDPDRPAVMERAFQAGVAALLCPMEVTDGESRRKTRELIENYPRLIAAAGVHPHSAGKFSDDHEKEIRGLAQAGIIHAIGEIGLDFHYNYSPRDIQISVFRRQLRLAQEVDLPVVVHSRLAQTDILAAVDEEGYTRGGVLHCFTENRKFAEKMLDRGFFISFSGIVTFPQAADIREAARTLPLDRMMVETDAPFLAPVPYRGKVKRNEPAYVRETARFLAELKGMSLSRLAEATSRSFQTCFGFEFPEY